MGFEILPIEDGDEDLFDIIPITGQAQWTPRQFMDKESPTTAHTVAVDEDSDVFLMQWLKTWMFFLMLTTNSMTLLTLTNQLLVQQYT